MDDVKHKPDKKMLERQLAVLEEMLQDGMGSKAYNEKVKDLDLEGFLKGDDVTLKIYALQRLVLDRDQEPPRPGECLAVVKELRTAIIDMLAQRVVKEKINKELRERIQQRQDQYMEELKLAILKKHSGPENPTTLKKYARLQKLERRSLGKSIMEILRPSSIDEIVGQQRAIKALVAKISSPYPQHVLLYGPPGVGKTSAARLAR